ncbi:MAG: hypothetical protein ACOVOT_08610 [Rubrivivax sp.]
MAESDITAQIAATAAALVVDEGLDYAGARHKAGRELARREGIALKSHLLPDHEAIEDAVREHIALFHADEQPAELAALRAVARRWMQRMAAFRPHLAGAVWRGTATVRSAVHIDLYADDPKAAEIALIDTGLDFDTGSLPPPPGSRDDIVVLTVATPSRELGDTVTVHLHVHDYDGLRGALKTDSRGRSWRGDLAALDRLLQGEAAR